MDDMEITRRCAEAMGYKLWQSQKWGYWTVTDPDGKETTVCENWPKFDPYSGEKLREPTAHDALLACDYNPLTDDAQAMALVKALRIDCTWYAYQNVWCATAWADDLTVEKEVFDPDLNRAICLAVAQRGKE